MILLCMHGKIEYVWDDMIHMLTFIHGVFYILDAMEMRCMI